MAYTVYIQTAKFQNCVVYATEAQVQFLIPQKVETSLTVTDKLSEVIFSNKRAWTKN